MFTESYLKTIFDTYYASLVAYANRFLSSHDECEDVVQDIFADLWQKENNFPDEISLKSYLYKTSRNKCLNIIKHNKVKDKYATTSFGQLNDDNLFMQHVLEEDISRQLYEAINTLPTRKRQVIILSLKGLKNKEVAENLNIKLQTVKTLKSQAYKLLRQKFQDLSVLISFLIAPIMKL
ncbi:RNA polymerase sigma-70 factor [Gelidibacter mesophilus]|uniref:RNA polymerase sigma-70 factor n=1 Tax=Gelidibacter mesophilus TaxID=169050 RepID=UPI00040C44D8|nr:RNA polymerase sigma-70 factor [Gelidibacter mesophilus]